MKHACPGGHCWGQEKGESTKLLPGGTILISYLHNFHLNQDKRSAKIFTLLSPVQILREPPRLFFHHPAHGPECIRGALSWGIGVHHVAVGACGGLELQAEDALTDHACEKSSTEATQTARRLSGTVSHADRQSKRRIEEISLLCAMKTTCPRRADRVTEESHAEMQQKNIDP